MGITGVEHKIYVSKPMEEKIQIIAENFPTLNAAITHILYRGLDSHPTELENITTLNTLLLSFFLPILPLTFGFATNNTLLILFGFFSLIVPFTIRRKILHLPPKSLNMNTRK